MYWLTIVLVLLTGCHSRKPEKIYDYFGEWSSHADMGNGQIQIIKVKGNRFICTYREFDENNHLKQAWSGTLTKFENVTLKEPR